MIRTLQRKLFGSPALSEMSAKIDALSISRSGVDEEGDPFVKFSDGTIFFGHMGETFQGAYRLLGREVRRRLARECVQVAADIVIRYVEGGLRYGGPRKQKFYRPGAGEVVSEMGAYEGFCSIKLAKQVGDRGRVIAIEPMEDNHRLLLKNQRANKLEHLVPVNRAVWHEEKTVELHRRRGDAQSSSIEMSYSEGGSYEVRAETLDAICEREGVGRVDFMIIQLNGAEINALRGLRSLKPRNLAIAARYDTEGVDAATAIRDVLAERGYTVTIEEEDYVFARLSE